MSKWQHLSKNLQVQVPLTNMEYETANKYKNGFTIIISEKKSFANTLIHYHTHDLEL